MYNAPRCKQTVSVIMLSSIQEIKGQNPTVTKIYKKKARTEKVKNTDSDFYAEQVDVQQSVLLPTENSFFSILERIGSGAFGVVKRALNLQSNKEVVAKIHDIDKAYEVQRKLTKRDVIDDSVVMFVDSQLETEENLTKALNRFYGSMYRVNRKGVRKKYVFMEYFKGENLAERLKGDLSVLEKLKLVIQMAQEVKHIHDLGYLHLDLSLFNILHDGQIRIIDFGLSVFLKTETSVNGDFRGSHIPPEMFGQHERDGNCILSPKVDIFALGMIIYEIFSSNKFDPYKYTEYEEYKAYYSTFYQAALREVVVGQDDEPWKKIVSRLVVQNPENRINIVQAIEQLNEYAKNYTNTDTLKKVKLL